MSNYSNDPHPIQHQILVSALAELHQLTQDQATHSETPSASPTWFSSWKTRAVLALVVLAAIAPFVMGWVKV